jgi:hypothetical protein
VSQKFLGKPGFLISLTIDDPELRVDSIRTAHTVVVGQCLNATGIEAIEALFAQ